ncbi:MAG: hypothetical protein HKL95_00360 [Phycisphaerae bacterium]|nr:hypothetical protein [Phycisphaerae bacterium]
MSEKQLMVILALIGIVAFTAWVVHQSIPSAPQTSANHATTRPGGSSPRPHRFAHAPVSAARVVVVSPVTLRDQASSAGVSVVAVYHGAVLAKVHHPGIGPTATMPAFGPDLPEGYQPVSGAACALLPPAARAQRLLQDENRLDFDALHITTAWR